MRKFMLLLVFLMTSFIAVSQSSIIMNDTMVKEYFTNYVSEAFEMGYDIEQELLDKIDYIIIRSDGVNVCELGETNLKIKLITLDSRVKIDRLILKITLYRELSYVLGVPYNTSSVIMNRRKIEGFSYSAFDDVDIMDIELSKVLSNIN